MKVIVLAGGSGKRLWPLSSETYPKQFLDFETGASLLQQTVNRFPEGEMLIVTNRKHYVRAQKQLGSNYSDTILLEPEGRNTAPAICLSVKYLLDKEGGDENTICVVCPSDHYFANEEDFSRLIPQAEEMAKSGNIVTFGVTPTYAETGYGYIQAQQGEVTRFIEKPSLALAETLLEEGNYYWNAGIFVFQIGTFLQELSTHAPEFFEWFSKSYEEALASFSSLPALSIDHALMEKTSSIALIPYPSPWSDLGTWSRLASVLPKDGDDNFLSGEIQAVDTNNCLIFGEGVVTLGVEDLLIVKVGEQVVVCHRSQLDRLSQLQARIPTHDASPK